jgi:hypothetical protein
MRMRFLTLSGCASCPCGLALLAFVMLLLTLLHPPSDAEQQREYIGKPARDTCRRGPKQGEIEK